MKPNAIADYLYQFRRALIRLHKYQIMTRV